MPIHELSDKAKRRRGLSRCPQCMNVAQIAAKMMPQRLYICRECANLPKQDSGASTAVEWTASFIQERKTVSVREVKQAAPFEQTSIGKALYLLVHQYGVATRLRRGVYAATGRDLPAKKPRTRNRQALIERLILGCLKEQAGLSIPELIDAIFLKSGRRYSPKYIQITCGQLCKNSAIARTDSPPTRYFAVTELLKKCG